MKDKLKMKNYTPARQELKKRGWQRRDRHNTEQWVPPGVDTYGFEPIGVSFESACKREGIDSNEDEDERKG